MRVWPGQPYPLGSNWDGAGVNFALFSEHATKVELCLFDDREDSHETTRLALPENTDHAAGYSLGARSMMDPSAAHSCPLIGRKQLLHEILPANSADISSPRDRQHRSP